MSKLIYCLTFRLPRLGLSITLSTIFLIGMLTTMNFISQPAQVHAAVVTDEAVVRLTKTADDDQLNNYIAFIPRKSRSRVSVENVASQNAFTSVVVVTPTAVSHEFKGVGVHIFDSDHLSSAFTYTLDALGLKYIRIQYGPNWSNIITPPLYNDESYTLTHSSMYTYIEQHFNGDYPTRLTSTVNISNIAQYVGVETILLNWRAPLTWLITSTITGTGELAYRLKEGYEDEYACFVTQIVKFLTNKRVKISYLEPTNEPSDMHNTKLSPEQYNTFVKFLRKYLDREGLKEVKILGPGLGYLNHDGTGVAYINALDNDAVAAIGGWMAHAWDPKFFTNTREVEVLRIKWRELYEAIKEKEDPNHPKPIFINEFACVNDPGNGVCAIENTLTLVDLGANAVIYWYLRAQSWDTETENYKRALLTDAYTKTAIFTAFNSVLPLLTGDEVKVIETQVEGRITAASFYRANRIPGKNHIVTVLINNFPTIETVLLKFAEFDAEGVKIAALYDGNTNTTINCGFGSLPCPVHLNRVRVEYEEFYFDLPPNTILILAEPYVSYLPTMVK